MATATFRFHDELNRFLPRQRREREFRCRCAQAATAKHMIEALGIPHTEVGTVLVNGENAGMSRMLADGDCVEIFPHDGRSPAKTASAFGEPEGRPMRFIADAHLGGLARLLRMAGFDTLYDNLLDDDHIEEISQLENRTVLSRDRELLKRRNVRSGCYVHALSPTDQFRELCARLGLPSQARPFSVCLHCNVPLRAVARSEVLDRIPESVRRFQEDFSTCDNCRRVYWKGSHWERMRKLLLETGISAQ